MLVAFKCSKERTNANCFHSVQTQTNERFCSEKEKKKKKALDVKKEKKS